MMRIYELEMCGEHVEKLSAEIRRLEWGRLIEDRAFFDVAKQQLLFAVAQSFGIQRLRDMAAASAACPFCYWATVCPCGQGEACDVQQQIPAYAKIIADAATGFAASLKPVGIA